MLSALYKNTGLKIKKQQHWNRPSACKFFEEQNDRSERVNY